MWPLPTPEDHDLHKPKSTLAKEVITKGTSFLSKWFLEEYFERYFFIYYYMMLSHKYTSFFGVRF